MKSRGERFENSQLAYGCKGYDPTIVLAGDTQFACGVAWLPQNRIVMREKGE